MESLIKIKVPTQETIDLEMKALLEKRLASAIHDFENCLQNAVKDLLSRKNSAVGIKNPERLKFCVRYVECPNLSYLDDDTKKQVEAAQSELLAEFNRHWADQLVLSKYERYFELRFA